MKDIWSIEELQDHFRLSVDEMIWLSGQEPHNQLGSAVFLKIFQYQGRFPSHKRQVSPDIVTFIAQQLTTDVNSFETYDWAGRSSSRTRRAIYEKLGIRDTTTEDAKGLSLWLSEQPMEQTA